jgi:hypothetical protein
VNSGYLPKSLSLNGAGFWFAQTDTAGTKYETKNTKTIANQMFLLFIPIPPFLQYCFCFVFCVDIEFQKNSPLPLNTSISEYRIIYQVDNLVKGLATLVNEHPLNHQSLPSRADRPASH